MKKYLTLFMAFMLLFTMTFSASAAVNPASAKTYILEEATSLNLPANETRPISFSIPFNSRRLIIDYTAAETINLQMVFNFLDEKGEDKTITETATLRAAATNMVYSFQPNQGPLVRGDITFMLTATGNVTINSMTFTNNNFGLMPGAATYTLAEAASTNLSAGGEESFDFYLPFDSESVTISYSAGEAVSLQMASSTSTETVQLVPAATETTYFFDSVQRKGEFTLTLTASAAVTINSIVFNKAQVQRPASGYWFSALQLTEQQETFLSSVIIDRHASAIVVNGGTRYIDYADAALTGDIIDGRLYLPAHTLARALGYYIEDYPEQHYLLLRHERVEYCFTNQLSYKETYNGYDNPVRETVTNPLIYKNGKAYLPVREFAEALGKTVGFRDGLVIIDDKYTVEKVLSSNSLFSYARGLLADYRPAESAIGTTYYVEQQNVAANDDDPNAGTQAVPFKTLAAAAAVAEAGDTVLIGSGTYRETLTPQNSGTATAPIIFQAAEGADVVISALDEVTGFAAGDGGVYTAPLSWDLGTLRNQVFYGGEVLTEARYPNGDQPAAGAGEEPYDASWPVRGDLHLYTTPGSANYQDGENAPQTVISSTLLDQADGHWTGGTFIGLFGYCYWMDSAEILSSTSGKLTIEPQESTGFDNGSIYGSESWGGWSYGYITGHKNCMDIAGEWVIEDGSLSLIPPSGADTANLTVEVKRRQLVADFSGKDYIQLRGVTTIGGSMLLNDSDMCVVDGCEILYNNHFLRRDDSSSSYYDSDSLMSKGENGIYVSGTGNAFINNNIYEAAGAAIIGTGTYMYIENNDIKNCGYAGVSAGGLYFPAGDLDHRLDLRGGHSIYSNTVARSGRSVLLHGGSGSAIYAYLPEEIAFNDFHDGSITALDTGITYEYFVYMGAEKLKTRYHNNYVYTTRPKSNPFSFGIYHDGGAEFIDTYNNVIFTTAEGVRITSGGSNPGDTAIYTQMDTTSWADCDKWNNISLTGVTGGPTALAAKDFPDERPFHAGASREGDRYSLNYNKIVGGQQTESDTYFVKDAALGGDAALQGNAVYLAEGQSATFTVNLGDTAANSFLVGYLGDKYDGESSYTLAIGENTYDFTLTSRAATTEQLNMQAILTKTVSNNVASFQSYSGTQTVTITCTGGGHAGLVSIKPRTW